MTPKRRSTLGYSAWLVWGLFAGWGIWLICSRTIEPYRGPYRFTEFGTRNYHEAQWPFDLAESASTAAVGTLLALLAWQIRPFRVALLASAGFFVLWFVGIALFDFIAH